MKNGNVNFTFVEKGLPNAMKVHPGAGRYWKMFVARHLKQGWQSTEFIKEGRTNTISMRTTGLQWMSCLWDHPWTLFGFTRGGGGWCRRAITAGSSLLGRQTGANRFSTNQSCNCQSLLFFWEEVKSKSTCIHMHVCHKVHFCKWKTLSWMVSRPGPSSTNVLQNNYLRMSWSQSNMSQNNKKKRNIRSTLQRCFKKRR